METCLILEDNPNTIKPERKEIRAAGLEDRLVSRPDLLKARLDRLGKRGGKIAGILLDNHIPNFENLEIWGMPEVTTDGGSAAGARIATEVIIPLMSKGELPQVPVAVMSAHDVDRDRSSYKARSKSKFEGEVFFFRKASRNKGGAERADEILLKDFVTAMARHSSLQDDEVDRLCMKLIESFSNNYSISDEAMGSIFCLRGGNSIDSAIARGSISTDTSQWREMAYILARLDALLSGAFGTDKSGRVAARRWLKKGKLAQELSPIEALMSGEVVAGLAVLDAATFSGGED